MNGEMLLKHAAGVVENRRATYGEPSEAMAAIAKRWSLTLGVPVTAAQVVLCLIDLKLTRLARDPKHLDSVVEGTDHYWCGARDQGDVWFFDKPAKNDLHPTMKPVALVERAIRNSSKSRDIVLDPFGGSGTTMIAAERAGRRARLIELDPKCVDVIVQRWQQATGGRAKLHGDERRFDEVSTKRVAVGA